MQTKVPPLSHYTSAEGLLGICSSNSIWATCAQYSNDTSEVLYAQSVAKEVLNEFFQGRQLTESAEFVRSFLEKKTGLVEGTSLTVKIRGMVFSLRTAYRFRVKEKDRRRSRQESGNLRALNDHFGQLCFGYSHSLGGLL